MQTIQTHYIKFNLNTWHTINKSRRIKFHWTKIGVRLSKVVFKAPIQVASLHQQKGNPISRMK
jgi:hypothetical protein